MDPFDEDILRTLRGRAPMDFQQILDEVGFSHNTLRLHLNNLTERGLI
jgi:DNA-binding Lrp family transcriptional regulator